MGSGIVLVLVIISLLDQAKDLRDKIDELVGLYTTQESLNGFFAETPSTAESSVIIAVVKDQVKRTDAQATI
jgi:hypothetical protein